MIVDEVKITVEGGHGGKGLSTFSKIKFAPGPTGGNGGKGGDIFIEGVADLGYLRHFRFKKDYKAENGENGKSGLHDGRNAEDLILFVPVGTVCHNLTNKKEIEITKGLSSNEKVIVDPKYIQSLKYYYLYILFQISLVHQI